MTIKPSRIAAGWAGALLLFLFLPSCAPSLNLRTADRSVPERYGAPADSANAARQPWESFFPDPYLGALIDSALARNQEFRIMAQEIAISGNEVRAAKGEYLPSVDLGAGAGLEKVGYYTSQGVSDATSEYAPGKEVPEHLQDYLLGFFASWEVDVWHRLRNQRQAAQYRYLSSVEGRRFLQTELVAEIANSYYELLALDNQLAIVQRNLRLQQEALRMVRLQKEAAEVTELAVRRFEAEVLMNRSRQYELRQAIVETENRINLLVGRFPQPVERAPDGFTDLAPAFVAPGLPVQLLENRPDVRAAEARLEAAKLDVAVARANFYPRLGIRAGLGYQAFNLKYFITTPESLLYNVAADLMVPLVNRNALKAEYASSGARQMQAVLDYERTVLNAYIEVANQLSMIENLGQSVALREQQVETLNRSIDVSTSLFQSARADYMEVLLTQRDALEAKMEWIETKRQQMMAGVNAYRALGGGWR